MSRKISTICYLLHTQINKKINLPHEETKIIGRNEETEVQDLYVSKNQIECTANIEKYEVKIKAVGRGTSGIDGYAMIKDKTYTIGHGHIIELRLGCHQYKIIFDPPPKADEEPSVPSKKQKTECTLSTLNKEVTNGENDSNTEKWEDINRRDLLIYTSANCKALQKIAAFDIDGTIIRTKSGARFPKDADDWELYFRDIPQHLKKLSEQNFKIVLFTNQSGVGKDPYKIKDFKRKMENIVAKLLVPLQIFVATGKTVYRKPAPGMWNTLLNSKNNGVPVDLSNSFYVGDAAGREKNWAPKRNKDHSLADRLFALNIGIKFYTPEEYFLKARSTPYSMPEFDPRNLTGVQYPDFKYSRPNVILMVGGPGSGKTYFCTKILLAMGYIHINRDKLGSWQKCVKLLEEKLQCQDNCVIDNTNPDRDSRARFIEVAKKNNVDCYCFVMTTNLKHTKHNNKFRELTDTTHVPVSEIIINSYKKNFQEPDLSEGFKEIVKIPFRPEFDNSEHEKLYKMFLLEK